MMLRDKNLGFIALQAIRELYPNWSRPTEKSPKSKDFGDFFVLALHRHHQRSVRGKPWVDPSSIMYPYIIGIGISDMMLTITLLACGPYHEARGDFCETEFQRDWRRPKTGRACAIAGRGWAHCAYIWADIVEGSWCISVGNSGNG